MLLPIIIILERHWDAVSKEATARVLPSLAEKGYDVLCFESPSDEGEEALISGIKSTIQFSQERLSEASTVLRHQGIEKNLTEMNYSDLQNLLLLFVSSQHSKELALWFRELPGHEKKLNLVTTAKALKMNVSGVDLVSSEIEQLRCMETQTDIKKKASAIRQLDSKRITSFKKHLLSLQQEGKGVIFVVGQFHYDKLVSAFSNEYALSDVIFAHPHSPKSIDVSLNDSKLPDIWKVKNLTLIDQKIVSQKDYSIFSKTLHEVIEAKINSYQPIKDTTVSKQLIEKTGLSFNLFLRQSMHVDAYYPVTENENISLVTKHLDDAGIKGKFTFFKERRFYCIPSINSTEKGYAITRSDKLSNTAF